MYIIMGAILIIITFLWSNIPFVPKAVLLVVGIDGMIPVIIMLLLEHEKKNEKAFKCWKNALIETGLFLPPLLTGVWIVIYVSQIVGPEIRIDAIHMIPYLIGYIYLDIGMNYKTFLKNDEYLNDDLGEL